MKKIRTSLQCTVRRQSQVFDQFIIIEWFRENTTGAVEDLDQVIISSLVIMIGHHDIIRQHSLAGDQHMLHCVLLVLRCMLVHCSSQEPVV